MPEFPKANGGEEEVVRRILEHVKGLQKGRIVLQSVTVNGRTGMLILLPVPLHPAVAVDVMAGIAYGMERVVETVQRDPGLRPDRPMGPG